MTAPAEDPRGGEACRCGHFEGLHGEDDTACLVWRQTDRGRLYCSCPSFDRRPVSGEAVTLNGHEVPVVVEPELEWRGTTTWTPDFNGRARPPVRIRLRNGPGDLDGRVLLHEVLHVLVGTDPQAVLPPDDPRHEDFVRMLTAGLHDAMGYRRTLAARPAGDRAQPAEEVREAIARTLSETVLRLRFSDDDAPWPSEDDVSALADALLAGPLAALLDAQAAVERVEALLERRGIWPTPIKDELHRALGGTA